MEEGIGQASTEGTPQTIETAQPPDQSPAGATQAPSEPTSPSSESTSPEAPKPLTSAEILEHVKSLGPEERVGLSKELRTIEEINAEYQRDLAHRAATARQQIEQTVREEAELRSAIEKDYSWFQSPEGQRALLSGNPQIAARHAEVVGYLSKQTETPIRERVESEIEGNAETKLRTGLASRPELKIVADHWTDISAAVRAAGHATVEDRIAEMFISALGVLAKSQYAQVERRYRADMEAKVNDKVAEHVGKTDEPVLVGAGVGGKQFSSADEVTAAHARMEIDNPEYYRQMARFSRR